MSATRSVVGWDIVVEKRGTDLFFDKRPNSRIDFVTVNENWNEITTAEKDSINHPDRLANEATSIAHNFSQQVLDSAEHKFQEKNPFLSSLKKDQTPASIAYRYRRWKLSENIQLVARTSLNAFILKDHQPKFIHLRSLNQFDSKLSGGNVDWREKLETQAGAVLATEMKNNIKKLTRCIAEAHLSGADEIRIGFVTRKHAKDPHRHDILMVQKWKSEALAQSARVRIQNLWGVLKEIVEMCYKLDEGKYLLLKDPNDSKLQLYSVPNDAFTDEVGETFQEA